MSGLSETSKGLRTAIAVLGRRNAGKSSLINSLVGFDLAIVSDVPGTTTDPVDKAVEIQPLGPCLMIDTAGIDDSGDLGQRRVQKTLQVIEDADVGLLVIGDGRWSDYEETMLQQLRSQAKPVIIVINKTDLCHYSQLLQEVEQRELTYVLTSTLLHQGIDTLKNIIRSLKDVGRLEDPSIIGDLVRAGDLIILVVPIDLGAPKGRLILPQVQVIRDILDNDAGALVVKERELADTLNRLVQPPKLVITDSQVVLKVSGDVPSQVPLTTFSMLFARFKGDLPALVKGARSIDSLRDGDRILIAEACTHHALADDIGRVKIPRWIMQYTGKEIYFDIAAGPKFPDHLEDYRLIVQCGGCTITRRAYMNRIIRAAEAGIPITNYGVAISYVQGVLDRALSPFPEFGAL